MRFNRVVNPSTGWRDSLFQEHRVGPPGGCVEGSVFFCVCVAAAASRLSVGAETETLEDDEDGEDDDDDQRDAESLRDVFFGKRGRDWFSSLTEEDTCGYSHGVYRPCWLPLSPTGG